MSLPILEIPKRYKDGQPYFEAFVDDIKFSTEEWALAIVRSMNQFGQDVFGSNYPFNNNGLPTRAIPLIDYLAALSENETVTGNWTFSGSTTFGNVTFGGTITVAGAAVFNGTATFNQAATFNSTSNFVGKITAVDIDVNGVLRIQDSTNSFYYTVVPSALAANRNITLPILLGDDVFVFADFIQTLTNKTLVTPVIASFINANHNHSDAANGGTIDHGVLTGLSDNDHPQYGLVGSNNTWGGTQTFTNAPVVPNNSFTVAKLQQIGTDTVLGRDTAGTGNVEVLSMATLSTMLGLANFVTINGNHTMTGTLTYLTGSIFMNASNGASEQLRLKISSMTFDLFTLSETFGVQTSSIDPPLAFNSHTGHISFVGSYRDDTGANPENYNLDSFSLINSTHTSGTIAVAHFDLATSMSKNNAVSANNTMKYGQEDTTGWVCKVVYFDSDEVEITQVQGGTNGNRNDRDFTCMLTNNWDTF